MTDQNNDCEDRDGNCGDLQSQAHDCVNSTASPYDHTIVVPPPGGESRVVNGNQIMGVEGKFAQAHSVGDVNVIKGYVMRLLGDIPQEPVQFAVSGITQDGKKYHFNNVGIPNAQLGSDNRLVVWIRYKTGSGTFTPFYAAPREFTGVR